MTKRRERRRLQGGLASVFNFLFLLRPFPPLPPPILSRDGYTTLCCGVCPASWWWQEVSSRRPGEEKGKRGEPRRFNNKKPNSKDRKFSLLVSFLILPSLLFLLITSMRPPASMTLDRHHNKLISSYCCFAPPHNWPTEQNENHRIKMTTSTLIGSRDSTGFSRGDLSRRVDFLLSTRGPLCDTYAALSVCTRSPYTGVKRYTISYPAE